MTHYEALPLEAQRELQRKEWARQKARKDMEVKDANELFEQIKDVSDDDIDKEQLKDLLSPMLSRVRKISDAVPNLVGLKLADYLERPWELSIRKHEEGDISFGANREYDSLDEGFFVYDESIVYVNYHLMRIGQPKDSQLAITLVNKRLNQILPAVEKALGLSNGEPIVRG